MLRTTRTSFHMMPRNQGVAPKWDAWSDKYDPWAHLRRMAKLVGTGFYIPPNWYNHFRMFPPIQHSFKEEQTLNPNTVEELTQEQYSTISEERKAVREELAKRSRSLASSGMRYYNIFWVEKPLDDAERQYYVLRKSNGLSHEEALKRVLGEFYEKQALRRRSHMIQSEEAQMTGKFLTMREAMSVVQLLGDSQKLGLAPHQFSEIASRTANRTSPMSSSSLNADYFEPTSRGGDSSSSSSQYDNIASMTMDSRIEKEMVSISPDALHDSLTSSSSSDDSSSSSSSSTSPKKTDVQSASQTTKTKIIDRIVVSDSSSDSVEGLKNLATSSTGDAKWLDEADGHTPKY